MHNNTEFTLTRDCEAILIPSGAKTTIPAGTPGVITQTLGGSYTIATYQGLARVAEKDLDALGLEKPAASNGAEKPAEPFTGEVDEKAVWDQLRQCFDPEIPVNIVDLGLVYDCQLTKRPEGGVKVAALAVVNAVGSVTVGDGPWFWAAPFEIGSRTKGVILLTIRPEPRPRGGGLVESLIKSSTVPPPTAGKPATAYLKILS